MIVSVGHDSEPYDIAATQPWSDEHVVWRWVARDDFRRLSYHATGLDRFQYDTDADVVLFADADTVFANGIDDLLQSLHAQPAVAGVMAHVPPFVANADETWKSLLGKLGRALPPDLHQHTGWGTMFHRTDVRFGPVYYNFGAVFVSSVLLSELSEAFGRLLEPAGHAGVGYFQSQLALTLAIYELNLPHVALPPRYNFPNDPLFETAYPEDLHDLRVLHYLRMDEVQRDEIWQSSAATCAFLRRANLRPSNEALRRIVEKLSAL